MATVVRMMHMLAHHKHHTSLRVEYSARPSRPGRYAVQP